MGQYILGLSETSKIHQFLEFNLKLFFFGLKCNLPFNSKKKKKKKKIGVIFSNHHRTNAIN